MQNEKKIKQKKEKEIAKFMLLQNKQKKKNINNANWSFILLR